ncbi:MAG: succinylglutamate desuccinylase/aspartoacylase family protein [Deltaproteobacteria bacterium]|nr:succinylglutamate desuccinylase/aspartoacylase family protein [Deltaproteobacteria bacterium]
MTAAIEIAAREIGRVRGERAGPTLIVVGSLHGNEAGGVRACERVFGALRERPLPIAGELVMLAGNVGALREGRRYRVKDLNRVWREEQVAALRARDPAHDDAEDREQRELLSAIDEALARARGPAFLVDLHTTSAAGHPFVLFGDTIPQREFAITLPLPILLGLEEQVDGVLSEHMTRRGLVTLAVEGGQHDDPASIDHLAAVVWIALSSASLLARSDNPHLESALARLDRARGAVPRVLEVSSRRVIGEGDAFRMEPGFANLAPVSKGQTLATHTRGGVTETVRAPHDGWVMLPLYQGQGSDGFFWGRAVSERRLRASRLLRDLRLDRLLRALPGVSRDRGDRDRLRVDTRVARFYPLEVFHLFGFRKIREEGATLVVERRKH